MTSSSALAVECAAKCYSVPFGVQRSTTVNKGTMITFTYYILFAACALGYVAAVVTLIQG